MKLSSGRMIICVGIIWLVEFFLTKFKVPQPTHDIISIIVAIVAVLFWLFAPSAYTV